MKKSALALAMFATLTFGIACNNNKTAQTSTTEKTAAGDRTQDANTDIAKVNDDNIKDALHRSNLDDVNVHVDNDKKVVALSGDVKNNDAKEMAEQIAKQHSAGYVVSNEIAVRPDNDKSNARKVDSNLDDAIKSDWKALVARNNWDNQHINSDVKNGVITLKGDVDTQSQRTAAEKAAAKIPNVKQVVNELTVKNADK